LSAPHPALRADFPGKRGSEVRGPAAGKHPATDP